MRPRTGTTDPDELDENTLIVDYWLDFLSARQQVATSSPQSLSPTTEATEATVNASCRSRPPGTCGKVGRSVTG